MTKKNTLNEISSIANKVLKSRLDPLTKVALVLFIGVPTLVLIAAFVVIQLGIKLFRDSQFKETFEETNFDVIDTVYYEVRKVRATKDSLTQYVTFSVVRNNEFIDVTNSMRTVFPDMKMYKGRSKETKGTAVLRDYDIIQVQKNLGKTRLVQNIGD